MYVADYNLAYAADFDPKVPNQTPINLLVVDSFDSKNPQHVAWWNGEVMFYDEKLCKALIEQWMTAAQNADKGIPQS